MQKELDRRRYMGQVYTGKYETWQATELGIKTYGKWCDLVGWENLTEQKWKSSDDFMNLAIKRKWGEVVYDFNTKTNVVKQTKFGYDLFKTFEYWIDEKAQKRAVRKKQINGVTSGFQKILQGLPKFMQQISSMMASFAPPEQSDTERKRKSSKPKKKVKNNNNVHTFEKWNNSHHYLHAILQSMYLARVFHNLIHPLKMVL